MLGAKYVQGSEQGGKNAVKVSWADTGIPYIGEDGQSHEQRCDGDQQLSVRIFLVQQALDQRHEDKGKLADEYGIGGGGVFQCQYRGFHRDQLQKAQNTAMPDRGFCCRFPQLVPVYRQYEQCSDQKPEHDVGGGCHIQQCVFLQNGCKTPIYHNGRDHNQANGFLVALFHGVTAILPAFWRLRGLAEAVF